MPYTPLHLGPNGFVGLVLRKWIDLPVFLLVNITVDLEVWIAAVMKTGPLPIRYGHTLLVATAAGLVTAAAAYPWKGVFKKVMSKLGLPYKTGCKKMALSGVLGAWLHVLVDSLYRSNVVLFWPLEIQNPLCRFDKTEVEIACILLFLVALVPFAASRRVAS